MFFSILIAVLMSSFIALGSKEPKVFDSNFSSTMNHEKDSSIAIKCIDKVGEEFKYSHLNKKG